jgi:small basic protein (TIGR04137 family)
MSLDPSLKSKNALTRHRNVLSRAERIAKLEETGNWTEQENVFGLPKVAHRKAAVGGKTKKVTAPTAATATETPTAKPSP